MQKARHQTFGNGPYARLNSGEIDRFQLNL